MRDRQQTPSVMVESCHIECTERSPSRTRSYVFHEQETQKLQLEIVHLCRKLRSRIMVFSSIIKPSKDIVGSWGLGTGILHLLILKGMAKPRTEEGIAELLVLLLRHHMPEEGIHLRRGGEKTKVSWEL